MRDYYIKNVASGRVMPISQAPSQSLANIELRIAKGHASTLPQNDGVTNEMMRDRISVERTIRALGLTAARTP